VLCALALLVQARKNPLALAMGENVNSPVIFVKWLGGITIKEIAGLLSLTIGAVFRRINQKEKTLNK